ncbi:hypothetical protein [Thiohalocapsa marina]|uniref:hypothetical protein n=1 Tax=Thiohalocapsa marina TaxID=424902 RepID=UPI0036D9DAF7
MPFLADLHPMYRAPDSAADRALDERLQAGYAATHTPGPWHCDGISEYTGELLIRAANGDTVARVCCYGPQSDTPHAQQHNAALISAAPEMLAAICGLLDALPSATTHPAIKAARAVVSKATGSEA